jgi:hypothetical protein
MTECEAREIINEIRTVRPRKRLGRTLFELRPDNRLDVHTMNKALTRSFFSHVSDPMNDWTHPVVMEWWRSRTNIEGPSRGGREIGARA